MLHDISFALRAGEIVGLAGLVGLDAPNFAGLFLALIESIRDECTWRANRWICVIPAHAVSPGIALIPEDRGRDGLARQLPISYNVTAASLGRLSSWGILRRGAEHAVSRNTSASCASSAPRTINWQAA